MPTPTTLNLAPVPVAEEILPPPAPPPEQAAPAPAPAQGTPTTLNLAPGPAPQQQTPPPSQPAPEQLPPESPRVQPQQTALEQVPIVGPALQGAANVIRGEDPSGYRPAPADAQGLGPESYSQGIDQAWKTLAAEPNPGNLLQVAGAYKDMNRGGPTPWMADTQRSKGQYIADVLTTGAPGEWATQPVFPGIGPIPAAGPSFHDLNQNDPEIVGALTGGDRENIRRAYDEGYTTPGGTVYAPGAEAVHEYLAEGQTNPQNVLGDLVDDAPGVVTSALGGGLAGAGKLAATKGAPLAAKVLGAAATAVEVPTTAGLNLAVPGALKGAGALLKKTPLLQETASSKAQGTASEVAEVGAALLGEGRRAGSVGVPQSTLSQPAKGITRITTPSADLAYDIDPTYGPRVYDTPAAPTTWRPASETDFQTVMRSLREMPQADRHLVREPWFDFGMRKRDALGDDLIDTAAVNLPARGTLPAVSTGRNVAAHQRWIDEMADTLNRFDDPAGNRPVLYHLMKDFTRTLYEGSVHPFTRRPLAEHRLQAIRELLDAAPAHNDHYAKRQLARMERQLPPPPGTIGTGRLAASKAKTARGGGVATATRPYSKLHGERMQRLATIPKKKFYGGGGGEWQKGDFASGLLSRVPPRAGGDATAYENYQGLLAARLNNPPLRRGEVGAIGRQFARSIGASPSATTQRELDGLKEALERNGILPGATGMDAAQIDINLKRWLKDPLNASFTIDAPPGGATLGGPKPLGIYEPGGVEEALGLALDRPTVEAMEQVYQVNGVNKRPFEELLRVNADYARVREIARAQAERALTVGEQKELATTLAQLTKLHPEYKGITGESFAAMTDDALDRLSGATVGKEIAKALGYDPEKTNKALAVYDSFNQMLRSLILYSPARGVQYPAMQLAGNAFTNVIADRGALAKYDPTQIPKIVRLMKDPDTAGELPRMIRKMEGYGLGRSGQYGRVSRDQMGPYTWFSQPTAGGLRKTLGKLLAPQAIKNWADAGDTLHRQSLGESIFDPAVERLKMSLPTWTDEVFADARVRTGLPLHLNKADVEAAIARLEGAHPDRAFTPVQLREAIMAAAGGPGVANKTEVFNAADRVHRLYREQLTTIKKAAEENVNRVAFNPAETNLDAIMQRTFLFSWWNTRAANLYAQEIAKNPVMLGLFSRAVAEGQRNVREGQKEGMQSWIEFMRTPAGFAMSLNPLALSSSFLQAASMEGPSDKAELTGLGSVVEGFLGNNLFLAPLVKASLGWVGALGEDYYRQDVTGLSRLERSFNAAAEVANAQFGGFLSKTAGGNPALVPNVDLNAFQNILHEKLSGQLPGTQAVPGVDAQRTEQAAYGFYVQQELLRDNPELAVPDAEGKVYDFEQAYREVLANPDSDIAQRAMRAYVASLSAAPLSDKGGPLQVLMAAARDSIPLQMSTQPVTKLDRAGRVNRDTVREDTAALGMVPIQEKTAVDKAMGYLPYETEEARALELLGDEYWGSTDPVMRAANKTATAIRKATITEPITVAPGITFTPEELAIMSAKDRSAVANAWADNAGYGQEMDAAWANRDELLAANPDLANKMGWEEWIAEYPGGPLAALDATAAVNPNIARIANDPEFIELRKNNPEEAADGVRWMGTTVAGVKSNRYDFDLDPRYAGVVGGLDGSVGTWHLDERAASDAESSDWGTTIEADLADYEETVAKLNTYDPSGATAAQYTQNLINQEQYAIPYDAYDAGITGFYPKENDYQWSQYLDWAGQQGEGADTSPARWNTASRHEYYQERTIEIAGEMNAGVYAAQEPVVSETTAVEAPSELYPAPPVESRPPSGLAQTLSGVTDAARTVISKIPHLGFVGPAPNPKMAAGDPGTKPNQPPSDGTTPATTVSGRTFDDPNYTPGYVEVVPASDGIGVMSTPASDRLWMENMLPDGARVTSEYKEDVSSWGPGYASTYHYQIGHGAEGNNHAAYDIQCDKGPGMACWGSPMLSPVKGKVVCAGYGQGSGAASSCTYSQTTTQNAPDGSPPAHTITVEVGTDPDGNPLQLSFNHMATSGVTPGQSLDVGDALGTMGGNLDMAHVHLEGQTFCPSQGTWVILDPTLIVNGYYETNSACQ